MLGAGGSPYRLPLLVGFRKAKELVLTGKWISGKEAEKIGLVNRAVPASDMERAVGEMISELVNNDPFAMRLSKSYMNTTILSNLQSKTEMAMLSSTLVNASKHQAESMAGLKKGKKHEAK